MQARVTQSTSSGFLSYLKYLKPSHLLVMALFLQSKLMGITEVEAHQSNFAVIPIGPLPLPTKAPVPLDAKHSRYGQCLFFHAGKTMRAFGGWNQNVFYDLSVEEGSVACATGNAIYPHGKAPSAIFHLMNHDLPWADLNKVQSQYIGTYLFAPKRQEHDWLNLKRGLFFVDKTGEPIPLIIPDNFQATFLTLMGKAQSKSLTTDELQMILPPREIYEMQVIDKVCDGKNTAPQSEKSQLTYLPRVEIDKVEIFEKVLHWWKPSESAVQCKAGDRKKQSHIDPPVAVVMSGAPEDPLLAPQDTYVLTRFKP